MSAPKFTPGPWAVVDTHPSKSCFYIDRHDQPGEHATGYVAVICATTDETKRANARLIAAAPDLYETLRWVMTHAMAAGCRGYLGSEFFERIANALAKVAP